MIGTTLRSAADVNLPDKVTDWCAELRREEVGEVPHRNPAVNALRQGLWAHDDGRADPASLDTSLPKVRGYFVSRWQGLLRLVQHLLPSGCLEVDEMFRVMAELDGMFHL